MVLALTKGRPPALVYHRILIGVEIIMTKNLALLIEDTSFNSENRTVQECGGVVFVSDNVYSWLFTVPLHRIQGEERCLTEPISLCKQLSQESS